MAYENNLFICYPFQSDNYNAGWVYDLSKFLDMYLDKLFGSNNKFVESKQVEEFSDSELKELFQKTAVFAIVLPPNYQQHNTFQRQWNLINVTISQKGNWQVDEYPRVFKVIRGYIPVENQPIDIQNKIPYQFQESDYDSKTDSDEEKNINSQYWLKLVDLAYDIYHSIDYIKNGNIPHNSGLGVYLAETGADQDKNREILLRELKRHGHRVFPEVILPNENPELSELVNGGLEKSVMSIHLIGEDFSRKLVNSDTSVVEFQNNVAALHSEKNNSSDDFRAKLAFSRVIWIPPDLKLHDEQHKVWIEQLKRDSYTLKGAEMVQTPLEKLKSIVLQKLMIRAGFEKLQKGDKKQKIYIIYDKEYETEAEVFFRYFEESGYEMLSSLFPINQRNLVKRQRQNLVQCDAVFIYYSGGNDAWIKSKLIDIIKAPGFGRLVPFVAKAVYMRSFEPSLESLLSSDDFTIFHGDGSADRKQLAPFFDKLEQDAANYAQRNTDAGLNIEPEQK